MGLSTIARNVFKITGKAPAPAPAGRGGLAASASAVFDQHVTTAPSPQNALDIFQGEWSSALAEPMAHLQAGTVELFNDPRIRWFAELTDVSGKTVLELGPLEAGHSYMLEKLGVASIVAVESNVRAFLRCLIVKELYRLERVRFLCGDFLAYLRAFEGERFQIGLASGVLYHMQNPAELIELLARCCSEHLCFWTHHYDEAILSANPSLAPKFTGSAAAEHHGFRHTLYRQEYQAALAIPGFCGAGEATSYWMTRDDIFRCVRYFGFEVEAIGFEAPDHPNGPALAFVAKRV